MSGIRQAVIAVGIDGSPESLVAARWAADEAERRRLSLRLLHAYATAPLVGVPAFGVPADINEGLIEAGSDALAQAVAAVEKANPEVDFHRRTGEVRSPSGAHRGVGDLDAHRHRPQRRGTHS